LNQPRVGIWPVPENLARRTPVDKLIAFCLTLNDAEYFFTRKNPDSPTDDFRPGSRNEEVFDYLDQGLAAPVPGFGGSLGDRYGSKGVRRILTQIFDYIRGSVNLTDTFDAQYVSRFQVNAPYAFVPPRVGLGERGKGQVIPIRIAKNGEVYKGHGRFVTIKEAGLQIFAVAANQPPVLVDPATGIPTTAINPMHPWTANPPASATVTDKGDGTWTISAANAYPAIGGQSHAGLPFLPGIWPADPAVLTDPVRRAGVINPRYQGPATIWSGSPGGLPQPAPKTAANVLGPHETLIQAAFLVDPVVVNPGTPPYNGRYQVVVRGLDQFRADGKPMGFPSVVIQTPASMDTVDYGPGYYTISTHNRTTGALSGAGRYQERLTFVSAPVAVGPGTDHGATFAFSGGTITVELRTEPAANDPTAPGNLGELVQSAEIEFPASTFPTPLLAPMPVQGANSSQGLLVTGNDVSTAYKNTGVPSDIRDLTPSTLLTFDAASTLALNPNFGVGTAIFQNGRTRTRYGTGAGGDLFAQNFFLPERMTDPATDPKAKLTADTIRMVELLYGDARVAGTQAALDASFFRPHVFYHDSSMRPAHTLRSGYGSSTATNFRGTTDHPLSDAGLSNPSFAYTPLHSAGAVNNFRGVPAGADPKIRSLGAQLSTNAGSEAQFIVSGAPHATSSVDFQAADFAAVWAQGGDYDTGPGLTLDGPFIGKAVEGGEMLRHLTEAYDGRNTNPDFNLETFEFSLENTNNSPNRQISSAVMFGSLATGGSPQDSWRTLLFSPNPNVQGHPSLAEVPAAGSIPAADRAPDYLLLDFFSMPVVEPYAISEPFSTAGRVNMNAQLAPFTHIRRDTALRGVLRTALVSAVEDSRVQNRKVRGFQGRYSDGPGGTYTQFLQNSGHWAFRYPVHPGETLRQFEQRFANGDLFRSPSEICSLWLYPARQPTAAAPQNPASPVVAWDAASANIRRWWYDNPGGTRKSVTSDNMRERPYAAVYPRLTTKSNTYTAYVKVQVLQKVPGTRPDEWVENRDRVRGEYRGSSMIERYIDAADPALPDFAAPDQAGTSLDDF
ncbi:MAG TPA: Verru_Chthon cassette protein A, partial [Terrimicrobiaceae bacterium]|nr:Verru_Chthon cassette protein A [Terrimicrobiaceae bacterium]